MTGDSEIPPPMTAPALHLRRKQWSPFIVAVYVFAAGMAWAALTPPGGVPDEPTHVTYAAAVVRGDLGKIGDTGHPHVPRLPLVSVPAWVTSITACFASDPTIAADCQGPIEGEGEVVAPTRATWYPPSYYWVVGLPTLVLTEAPALYAMRAASVVLVTALIAAGLWVATPIRRRWLAIGVMLSFTPVVAHFAGSVNPMALEFAGVIGLSASLLGIAPEPYDSAARNPSRRAWGQAITILVTMSLLAWARPWSALVVGAVVGGSMILNYRSIRAWARTHRLHSLAIVLPALVLLAGAVVFELVWRGPIAREVADHASGPALGQSMPLLDNVSAVLSSSFAWIQQQIGLLGSLDHVAPAVVIAGWTFIWGFLLLHALAAAAPWQRVVLGAMVVGAALIAPLFIIEFTIGSTVGYQARYHMAAVLLLAAMTSFLLGRQGVGYISVNIRTVVGWVGGFLPIAMILALLASLSRYAIPSSRGWHDLAFSPTVWLPGTEALVVMAISMVVIALLVPATAGLGATAALHPFTERGEALRVERSETADGRETGDFDGS